MSDSIHPVITKHRWRNLLWLGFALILAMSASLMVGSVALHKLDPLLASEILWRLRWPRTLAAMAVGGLLALSGTLMQTITRNPLADPYIFGIASSAAVGALLALWWDIPAPGPQLAALIGALIALALILLLVRGEWTALTLTMTGVAVASLAGACIVLIFTFAPDSRLRGMLFWLMGDISLAVNVWQAWVALVGVLVISWLLARPLHVLEQGEDTAAALGVQPRNLKLAAFFLASVACAMAVITAGVVGFIGLLAPHMVRLLVGGDLRYLLPGAALGGAVLLTFADTAARTLIAPQQLPIGILTTLLGAPLFLYLLRRAS